MRSVRAPWAVAIALTSCGGRTAPLDENARVQASGGAPDVAPKTGGRGAVAGGSPVSGAGGDDSEPATPCRARDIGSSLGFPAAEGVLAGRSAASTDCGGKGPEAWFLWSPPFDGIFYIQAEGGEPPPILAIFDSADCSHPRMQQCSSSAPQVLFSKGGKVFVQIDTDATGGGFTLNIWGSAGQDGRDCASADVRSYLGSPVRLGPFSQDVSTTNYFGCTGITAPAVVTSWTAPYSGYFRFDTTGSDADTLLEVRDGCGGDSLGCSDDYVGRAALLELFFTQGGTAAIYVGDKSGRPKDHYTLAITDAGSGR